MIESSNLFLGLCDEGTDELCLAIHSLNIHQVSYCCVIKKWLMKVIRFFLVLLFMEVHFKASLISVSILFWAVVRATESLG